MGKKRKGEERLKWRSNIGMGEKRQERPKKGEKGKEIKGKF